MVIKHIIPSICNVTKTENFFEKYLFTMESDEDVSDSLTDTESDLEEYVRS